MLSKAAILVVCTALLAGGFARAADVSSDTQKFLTDTYALSCAAALDPTDKNLDAAFANMSPDYVNIDLKGNQKKRDEVIGAMKTQLKQIHVTTCTSSFDSVSQSDPATILVVATSRFAGDVQAPDGKHQLDGLSKAQDTWKLVGGKWLESQSKDLRTLIKIDGTVVQDAG